MRSPSSPFSINSNESLRLHDRLEQHRGVSMVGSSQNPSTNLDSIGDNPVGRLSQDGDQAKNPKPDPFATVSIETLQLMERRLAWQNMNLS